VATLNNKGALRPMWVTLFRWWRLAGFAHLRRQVDRHAIDDQPACAGDYDVHRLIAPLLYGALEEIYAMLYRIIVDIQIVFLTTASRVGVL